MKNNYNHIEIVFENCETIIIPKSAIKFIGFGGVDEHPDRYNSEGMSKMEYPSVVQLVFYKNKMDNLSTNMYELTKDTTYEYGKDGYRRLLVSDDITHIYIYNEDGTVNQYCVPWGEYDEFHNQAQKNTEYDISGELIISIKELKPEKKHESELTTVEKDIVKMIVCLDFLENGSYDNYAKIGQEIVKQLMRDTDILITGRKMK